MDAFVSYEQDFKELRDSIRKRVEIIGTSRGDAKRKEISLAQEELQDIEEVFQSLRLTAQSLGAAPVKAKVKAFEGELAELKAAIRRAETFFGSDADRGKLMGGVASASDLATTSGDQRGAVARDTERLRHTTDVIKDALRVASETEQIGRDSMQQLHTQHDEIESSRNKLRAVDQSLATANRLMRGMARRIMTNKLITMVIALILLGGIGLIVWLKCSPDAIVDSVGDNDGVREGVSASTGLPLVRFLNASSAFCKEGSCVTFWALSPTATMQSTGRITLRSQLDFPSLGGAIAFWLYMETESPYNPRLVAKFLPDASQSLFQIGLLEISPRNVNGTAFNRTSSVDGGEEYNYFVFRCYFQYKSTSGALVPSAEFQFKTHPFKQQWQHIAVSFGASGVKLFRDFTLMETLPLSNFSSYEADTTLPVTVGNHPAMQRAPAARIDELRFFAFNTPDDDVTEQNLQSLAKPVAPPTSFSFPSGARSTTKFRPFTTTPKSTTNGAVTTGTGDAVTTVAISGGGSSGSSSNSTASTTTALNGFEPIADEPTALPNKGALIGGLIGGLLAVILLLSLLVCVLVREKRRRRHDDVPVVVSTQQPPVAAVDSTSTLSTPNIGMYDRVPPAPTPVAAKRNMYTAAPRSTPAELLANYGSTPEPSNFDVRGGVGDSGRYDRAPEAKALYHL